MVKKKIKEIPNSLRNWFFMHFLFDYIFGIPLLFFPGQFLNLFNIQVGDLLAIRLFGAALLGIGGVSLLSNKANFETYNSLLNLKII